MSSRLTGVFNIRVREDRVSAFFLIHSLFPGMSGAFFRTASYSLFLTEFKPVLLPYVHIRVSIAVPLAAFACLKLERRLSFLNLLKTIYRERRPSGPLADSLNQARSLPCYQ